MKEDEEKYNKKIKEDEEKEEKYNKKIKGLELQLKRSQTVVG